MKKIIALLTLALTFSAFAEEQTTKKNLTQVLKENNISKSDLKKELIGIMNPSQANREGKTISFLVGTGSRHDMRTRNFTLEYYQNADTAFGLTYSRGRDTYASFDNIDVKELDATILEAHTKLFIGNSFYCKTGLAYRLMRGMDRDRYDYTTSTYLADERVYNDDLALTVDIGNQWQWQNFTLAMTWIGINYQIVGDTKFENRDGITANLMNFNIGMSF